MRAIAFGAVGAVCTLVLAGPAESVESRPPSSVTTSSVPEQRVARTLATPQAASKNLWDGWRDDDRPRALLYASSKSVAALFAMKWRPDVKDRGCDPTPRGGGPMRCFYAYDGGGANLTVKGNPVDGYSVVTVEMFGMTPRVATSGAGPTTTTTSIDADGDTGTKTKKKSA